MVSSSSLNVVNTKALVEENHNEYNIDSFDRTDWKWNTTEVVSTESTSDSYRPSTTFDSFGNIHIAWRDSTDYDSSGTDNDIFYKRWDATLSSWTTAEVLSTESTSSSVYPSLTVDSTGAVHVAWQDVTDYAGAGTDYDIFYKYWNFTSSSWTMTDVVSTGSTEYSQYPSLAVDSDDNVHVAWTDGTNYAGSGTDYDIFYKHRNATSSSWSSTEVVSTESTAMSYWPSLAVDSDDNVHVAWWDKTDYAGSGTDDDIFYKRLDYSTSSWTTTEIVSTESTDISYYPSLSVDSAGNIHVAWQDSTNYASAGTDYDIFYKRWDSYTTFWTTTEVVSIESTSDSEFPSLSADSLGNVFIAWQDVTDYANAGIDRDIFYKRWVFSASLWIMTEVVSTESTGGSYYPSLAVDSIGNVHVAWCDSTNYASAGTDYDIFYKLLKEPPVAPELAFIIPNPIEIDTINLNWNDVLRATSYHVYRSTSYIWSVEGLLPIATVSSSDYIDTVPSEGYFYYVVVASNFAGNSSHSNCQYVEVKFPELDTPELAPILPNPTELSSVSLVWDSIDGATEYYVYRSDTYIWSVEGLTPIDTVITTSYVDSLPSEDHYFYVIVANDGVRNSTHSNCEYVEYKLPTLNEFVIISGLILGSFVVLVVITRTRKKNSKQN